MRSSKSHTIKCLFCCFLILFSSVPVHAHDYLIEGGKAIGDWIAKGLDAISDWLPWLSSGGDPVALKTGEYYVSAQDMTVSGRAMSIGIQRRYTSKCQYNSRFGYGWDMNYNMKIRKMSTTPSKIMLLDGKSSRLEYSYDSGSDSYLPPNGHFDTITENIDGTFTLHPKHGGQLDFDMNGNLTTIKDRHDNSITLTYDPNALPIEGPSDYFVGQTRGLIAMEYKLTKMTDDLGRDITFDYYEEGESGPLGLLESVTDAQNRTWSYTYDAQTNDLLTVTTPQVQVDVDGTLTTTSLTTTYTYDDFHNLLTVTDAAGQTYLVNSYTDDQVLDQQYGWEQTGDGEFTFAYGEDRLGNPDPNRVTITDRRGYEKEVVLDENGFSTEETVYTASPKLRSTDPDSYTTYKTYDPNDKQLAQVILPDGKCVEYDYDTNGNLIKVRQKPSVSSNDKIETVYTYESNFNFIDTVTDPGGNQISYTYDYEDPNYTTEIGNLMKITYPQVVTDQGTETPEVNFTYNSYGQPLTVTSVDGIVTQFDYYTDPNDSNNYGRLWKTTVDYGTDPNCLNIVTTMEYDALGNPTKVTDAENNITEFTFNALSLLTKIKTPTPFGYETDLIYNKNKKLARTERAIGNDTQVMQYTYNTLDKLVGIKDPLWTSGSPTEHVTSMDYDNNDNLTSTLDAEDNETVSVYDERNLLWTVTDANDNTTEYSYTLNGQLETIEDAEGNVTTYAYDDYDRLEVVTYPDDSNEVYTYNDLSQIATFTNRNGDTLTNTYDDTGRLMSVVGPNNDPNIAYTYDIAGRVVEVDHNGDVTRYDYDRLGRLIQVEDAENRLVDYEYDDLSRRTALVYPDDSYVTYEYDELSRLTKIIDDSNSIIAEYTYDELSRRTLVTLENDANAVYGYDLANRLTDLDNNLSDPNNSTITFDYTHDDVGNRLTMTVDGSDQHSYTYDEIYQLTDVDYPTGKGNDTTYSYDGVHNRTDVNDGNSISYIANNLNQYDSVGGTNLYYDDNGNLTDDGTNEYVYDIFNRLTDIKDSNSVTIAQYTYDYSGRRIEKNVGGTVTKYAYDGGQVIAEYDGSDNLLRKYIYGPGIDEPICMIDVDGETETRYYYHRDGLGSVVALSNTDGDIVEAYSYDAFGTPTIYTDAGADGQWRTSDDTTATESAIGNPYMFTGRRYDPESGLYHYRARMYNTELGRFMQPDPVGYYDSANLYQYCVNDPINYADPLGLCKGWEAPLGGLLGGALSGALSGALMGLLTAGPAGIIPGAIAGAMAGAFWGSFSGVLGNAISGAFGGGPLSFGQGFQGGLIAGTLAGGMAGGQAGLAINAANAAGAAAGGAASGASGASQGMQLWRVWGGSTGPLSPGSSSYWTNVNPLTVSNYSQAAQLPAGNTGQFISTGILTNTSNVTVQQVAGGTIAELIVPNGQVLVLSVSGSAVSQF